MKNPDPMLLELRKFLKEKYCWQNHTSFAEDLMSFAENKGYSVGFTESSIKNIISRRCRTNIRRRGIILEFLADNNIYWHDDYKGFQIKVEYQPELPVTFNGKYQFFYDLNKSDPLKNEPYLNTRLITLKNDTGFPSGVTGTFSSHGIENGFSIGAVNQGQINILRGKTDTELLLIQEKDFSRKVPPVSLFVRCIESKEFKVFYGIGLGVQSEDTNTIVAVRVLGLPINLLNSHHRDRIFRSDLKDNVYDFICKFLNSENEYNTKSTLNSGPKLIMDDIRVDFSNFIENLISLVEVNDNDEARHLNK